MRAIVIYNQDAGFGRYTYEQIEGLLLRGDYQAECCTLQDERFPGILQQPCDVVIAVGGDGTVKTIIRELIGSSTPVHILPTGTSNNIAASCNIIKIAPLKGSAPGIQRIHLPSYKIDGKEDVFAESVGIGLLADMMWEVKFKVGYRNGEEKINNSMIMLKKLLKQSKEYPLSLLLDGKSYSGSYLAAEVMNTRFTGPKILLAPRARLDDAWLEVVLISSRERQALETYITDRLAGIQRPQPLPVYRARHIEIEGSHMAYHLDDKLYQSDSTKKISIYGTNSWVKVV